MLTHGLFEPINPRSEMKTCRYCGEITCTCETRYKKSNLKKENEDLREAVKSLEGESFLIQYKLIALEEENLSLLNKVNALEEQLREKNLDHETIKKRVLSLFK